MEKANLKMLFLDDIRYPQEVDSYLQPVGLRIFYRKSDIDIVRNYEQFCNYIENNDLPDIISFDHDLADEHYAPEDQWNRYDDWLGEQDYKEKTGYECAKFLLEFCEQNNLTIPTIFCHSQNPIGKENILNLFYN